MLVVVVVVVVVAVVVFLFYLLLMLLPCSSGMSCTCTSTWYAFYGVYSTKQVGRPQTAIITLNAIVTSFCSV